MPPIVYEPDAQAQLIQQLRTIVEDVMVIEEVLLLTNDPQPAVQFSGRLREAESGPLFETLLTRLAVLHYTPLLTENEGLHVVQVIPGIESGKTGNPWVNLVLFVLTLLVVLFTGALYDGGDPLALGWRALWRGLPFAGTLLGILTFHELSHYFVARRYGSPVSLPYFIPLPLSILGTMGAVIVQRGPMRSHKALFDIGAAGPLGGLVIGIPLLALGLALSTVDVLPVGESLMLEGNSLLYLALKYLRAGQVLPADGLDIMLHPVAFAAWAGLMVTALNLFPIGQLDGGHVAYALWGRKAWALARWMRRVMLGWGVLLLLAEYLPYGPRLLASYLGLPSAPTQISTAGWTWVLLAFLVNWMGTRHPAPLDDVTPLDATRRAVGWGMVGLFFLLLVPVPLTIVIL